MSTLKGSNVNIEGFNFSQPFKVKWDPTLQIWSLRGIDEVRNRTVEFSYAWSPTSPGNFFSNFSEISSDRCCSTAKFIQFWHSRYGLFQLPTCVVSKKVGAFFRCVNASRSKTKLCLVCEDIHHRWFSKSKRFITAHFKCFRFEIIIFWNIFLCFDLKSRLLFMFQDEMIPNKFTVIKHHGLVFPRNPL